MNNVKKSIGWCDWTINPVKGLCPVGCSYCYARRMYKRFKWNPEIRYDDWVWHEGSKIPPGSKVFVGSTIDLFHEKTIQYLPTILDYCDSSHSRTFIFLTKCPQNLPKEWPDNCWVGVSATDAEMFYDATFELSKVKAKVKIISFEPLLDQINGGECEGKRLDLLKIAGISWLIIGAQTPYSQKTAPRMSWVQEILVSAFNANIPVFMKNNLQLVMNNTSEPGWAGWKLRQEFPA